ncbi:hypothetical protein DM860_008806 [Cuscuta australis]|uniref:Cyclin N-terminal domain-containing protein n=1 Tax=Cuscuta australis TaxID=267555 RepID=A0A328D9K3_9ASTE|nr:hypothetical protein DM860_008806 [Cuscuta australis]
MAAVKFKSNSIVNRAKEDPKMGKNGGLRSFHIYSDEKRVKDGGHISCITRSKKSSLSNSTVMQNNTTSKRKLEKSKSKHGSGVKVGRKVLADISNTRSHISVQLGQKVLPDISNTKGSISRTEYHDGTTQQKTDAKKFPFLRRSSVFTRTTTAHISSRKPSMAKMTVGLAEASGKHDRFMRGSVAANKDLKAAADDPRAKAKSHAAAITGNRTTGKNSLLPLRKSLPALKRANIVNTVDAKKGPSTKSFTTRSRKSLPTLKDPNAMDISNIKKENAKVLEKGIHKKRFGVSAKSSFGRHTLPQENAESLNKRIGKHGFPVSAKPKVGRSILPQLPQMAARSKETHCQSSSNAQYVISSQQKQLLGTSSLCKYIGPIHSKLPSEVAPSNNSHDLSTSEADILTRKSSARRKSFTSLLVTRPKQWEEQTRLMEQKYLPKIYDDYNHLDVSEYVDDIYQYYWVMEAQHHPLRRYMEIQTEITPHMRGILINWLIEVHLKFDLMQETLFLMVTVLDQYISQVCIKKNELQLVGLTALLLASKYEDFWHPRIMDLLSVSAESYTREQMLGMEKAVLKKLMFRLNAPTPYVFMLRFLRASQADKKFGHLAFFLVELCLVEDEALNYKPSLICASAIYVARCTLHMTPTWTPMLESHARYEESQLSDCAEMILRFHKAARTSRLSVTFEKYMRSAYSKVAAINPLKKLPQ